MESEVIIIYIYLSFRKLHVHIEYETLMTYIVSYDPLFVFVCPSVYPSFLLSG